MLSPHPKNCSRLGLALLLSALMLLSFSALATQHEIKNPIQAKEFKDVITRFANFGEAIAGALMTLVVLYAGYLYLFSGGSEKMLTRARQALTWAVVGFIVILIARGVAELIKSILGTR